MKILSYAPDEDPTKDGVITACTATVPTYRGIGSAPSAQDTGNAALAAACIGAASLVKLDATSRTFAGTATKLYELSGGTYTDVSSGGGSYTSVTNRWRFAQYGNVSIAASKTNVTQYSSGSGAFADIVKSAVNAPKADIVETANDFVFLCNTNAGPSPYNTDATNRWWCSALGDYTDWTPSASTQCATGLLSSTPGAITAAKRFGDQIVLYKQQAMYIGTYLGPSVIWSFPEVPTALIGTWCQESVISLGTPEQPLHFFVGPDDFYLFDGARPVPVGQGMKEFFFSTLNVSSANLISLTQNRAKSLVYIFYPSGSSTTLDSCVVFNYRTKRWGRDDHAVEFAFEYINPGLTYTNLGSSYSTYADLPSASYDSAFAGAGNRTASYFGTDHKIYSLSGSGTTSTVTTADLGSDQQNLTLQRVTPQFVTVPTNAVMTNYYRATSGNTLQLGTNSTMSSINRFDVLQSAPWHRFSFSFSGDWEIGQTGLKIEANPDGSE